MLPASGIFIALFAGWVEFPKIMDGAERVIRNDFFLDPGLADYLPSNSTSNYYCGANFRALIISHY
jgi:hypothetical protein